MQTPNNDLKEHLSNPILSGIAPDTISAMNPVALYFASGESLYLGVGLLVLAIFLSPFLKRRME